MWRTREIQNFVLSIIFPQFCLQCGKETNMVNLCPDCFATIEILEYWFCPVCGKRLADKGVCNNCVSKTNLIGIFSASPYIDPLVKKIIGYLKYEPYLKDLSKTLADLIITHFSLLNNDNVNRILQNSILVPVPSTKDRIRIRNFNQAEEILPARLHRYAKHCGRARIRKICVEQKAKKFCLLTMCSLLAPQWRNVRKHSSAQAPARFGQSLPPASSNLSKDNLYNSLNMLLISYL
jgi:predicted amidophosphoribosyltransferase